MLALVVLVALATRAAADGLDDIAAIDDLASIHNESDVLHLASVTDRVDRLVSGFDIDEPDDPITSSARSRRRANPRDRVPLSAVIRVALRTAGLADDPVPGWRRRSRWAALVPALSSRIGNSQSWREVIDPTVSRALSYDIRASWRLERLVFDPNEPRFTAYDVSRRRERRRLVATVSHLYYAWADAHDGLAEAESTGPEALIQARRSRVELDALTNGWFSQAVAGARANPARSR